MEGALRTYLELAFDSFLREKSKYSNDAAFLYYFLILEALSKQIIDEENPHKVQYIDGNSGKSCQGYKFQFRSNYTYLTDFKGNTWMSVPAGSNLISKNKRIPYNPKFENLISFAGLTNINPNHIVDLRNNFNHPNLIENKRIAYIQQSEVKDLLNICCELIKKI